MRFLLDDEQREFARSLDAMLTASDTPGSVRAWAAGDTAPGRAVWSRLAEAGVFALAVPEPYEGLGPLPVELAVAFTELGRHAVPGPLVETVAAAALLDRLGDRDTAAAWLPRIAAGKAVVSLCVPAAGSPYALDADATDAVLVVAGDTVLLTEDAGPVQPSADPARRLARPLGGTVLARGPEVAAAAGHAADVAALITAAQALGLGRALLDRTVAYVKQRTQFGVAIGSFQAVKHRLADTLLALEFAQPLLHSAALALAGPGGREAGREIAAAKVAAGDAAYAAARAALQLHGAVGYTDELDLSLWIRKARPLREAWGTPAACRARVLAP
ncbi:Pimeloyl-CoA dehydrogenase, small subunit [Streptomyces venezuelae]|uniref:acyl-CoA dehydrogenase family protein n=1 Tax=Streptomyces gardneri TaxID=66892 RepID=UPI0007167E6B|nr:acyl-CoA dehydrogenase family protein [Streptomyces gardneri]ALO13243.1 Pimeloyl-CoA dehydrogenase, small subunit [Streptomyces venezuelae]QPK50934.1 acyl-CoA dehydrogenase family protein [Streptomyces gardneri]WRK42255.1 acyl-CoA dehydrogenase family protein [Streptomyces venezuelae]